MNSETLGITADIVAAFVGNNSVMQDALPDLIRAVYQTLSTLEQAQDELPALVPAVPVKKSVTGDYIVCLEDGKKLKTLKRHLAVAYGMTPEQYRVKWGLPVSYPMVAPFYAAKRAQMARHIGLGTKRVNSKRVPEPVVQQIPEVKRRRKAA